MGDNWKVYMERIVHRLLLKRDSGAFREPVDWEGMGLTDYLKVITRPMDLTTVQNRLLSEMYNSREECIQDIRLVWDNAKSYNKPGSKMHTSAMQMEEAFEAMLSAAVTNDSEKPVSRAAMQNFITSCHRIRREELREVILKLEDMCPECIHKNVEENNMNIEVDLMSPRAFKIVSDMIASYLSYLKPVDAKESKSAVSDTKRSASTAALSDEDGKNTKLKTTHNIVSSSNRGGTSQLSH